MLNNPEFRRKVFDIQINGGLRPEVEASPLSNAEQLALYRHKTLLELAEEVAVAAKNKQLPINRRLTMPNPSARPGRQLKLTLASGWVISTHKHNASISGLDAPHHQSEMHETVLTYSGTLLRTVYAGQRPRKEITFPEAYTRTYTADNFIYNTQTRVSGWSEPLSESNNYEQALQLANDTLENDLAVFVATANL